MKQPPADTRQIVDPTLEAIMGLVRAELTEHHALLGNCGLTVQTHTTWVDLCDKVDGASPDMTALNACLTRLGRDVHHLKSTNMSLLLSVVPLYKMMIYDHPTMPRVDVSQLKT